MTDSPNHGSDENSGNNTGRARAFVWEYFEKVTGDDGLPKTRCTNCNKLYSTTPRSGTSTMRRHLRKCCPQPAPQSTTPSKCISQNNTTRSNHDLLPDEVREAKKLKSRMVENLQTKTDRELVQFIWANKRNVGLLDQKFPHKANAVKEAIKCYEDEIDRRANLNHPKENSEGPVTSIAPLKIEADDYVDENMAVDTSVVGGETMELHADVCLQKTIPQVDNGKPVIKVEEVDQSDVGNENCDWNVRKEEPTEVLQIVAINGAEYQTSYQQTSIPLLPEDICADLNEVSSVLSMLNSPNNFYTPQGNPLDQEAEMAKELLTQLLKKDFETIVGSSDEQDVKSCINILSKNLHKLPRFQGRVIETLNTKFESACQNWSTWHTSVETNIAFEVLQGDNLEVLQEWKEKDKECESKIAEMDAEILLLKAELLKKELTRENLVKQKYDLFDQSKMSINEAKKLLKEMVTTKLQSDVAINNMKEVAAKWERIREKFLSSEQV